MRMYQEIGLKPEAKKFLEENAIKIPHSFCPACGHILSFKFDTVTYEFHNSFYGDGPHLQEYKLKNGTKVREIIQAEPWSSGPMAFFCLEMDGMRMFEWTSEEIEERLG